MWQVSDHLEAARYWTFHWQWKKWVVIGIKNWISWQIFDFCSQNGLWNAQGSLICSLLQKTCIVREIPTNFEAPFDFWPSHGMDYWRSDWLRIQNWCGLLVSPCPNRFQNRRIMRNLQNVDFSRRVPLQYDVFESETHLTQNWCDFYARIQRTYGYLHVWPLVQQYRQWFDSRRPLNRWLD